MESIYMLGLFVNGLRILWEYLIHHSLTYLIPGFLLAGAISAFLPYTVVVRYLSSESSKAVSFSLATLKGMVLATCSITILPIAKVLYKKGYGIAPTFVVLWTAPTMNILALTYTEAVMGGGMALWRLLGAVLIVPAVGLVISALSKDEKPMKMEREEREDEAEEVIILPEIRRFIVLVLLLIALLVVPNLTGARDLQGMKYATFVALSSLTAIYSLWALERGHLFKWLSETAWFARRMGPLILIGIFVAGVIGSAIPEDWIRRWLAHETPLSVLLAAFILSLTYMPMLAEVPLANELLAHGVSRGIALLILLLGSSVGIPTLFALGRLFGWKRSAAFLLTVTLLSIVVTYALSITVL